MPVLTHFVSLQNVGGVESHFAEFVHHTTENDPKWSHTLLNPDHSMNPLVRQRLGPQLPSVSYLKYRWGKKLPAMPKWLRTQNCRHEFKDKGTDILLMWNRPASSAHVLKAIDRRKVIYWEHGYAWFPGQESARHRFLRALPLIIANSNAAARVLRLRWHYAGDIRVCRNALRPSLRPERVVQKRFPLQRPVRIGIAGRLLAIKGVALAVQALKLLREQCWDAELHVAGAGPELGRLQALAAKLGVSAAIHFHGVVTDMRTFYERIDCLLHPALREPFGLVAIEAAAHGCPVIVSAVDGLPEAIRHGVSGYCVAPRLPLSDYPQLGGTTTDIPDSVYDPGNDNLCSPRIVDPSALADGVRALLADRNTYEHLSRTASAYTLREFDFRTHATAVLSVIDDVHQKGRNND